jgi:hypothetical protein
MFFKIFRLVINIKKFLENKKSYIVATSTIGFGVYQGFIASNGNWKVFMVFLLSGSFMATIKAAVVKAGTPKVYSVPK